MSNNAHSLKQILPAEASETKTFAKATDALFTVQSINMLGLVAIADRKAHMIISTNSIVLTIFFTGLVRSGTQQFRFIVPAAMLLTVAVVTTIYAILSVRPNIVKGKKRPAATEIRPQDLITEVIFSEMRYEDFYRGWTSLVREDASVYDSMTQGIYANGQVLQRKFKYLSLSYTILIYGLIVSVTAFCAVYFLP